ncbi:DNA polymerase-like protein [Marinobacterium lacunae]|uniref:DNA polymerase-like protein n=1 Tax=Marinobacterium lacunae TaxID=1232683 RepID=A0A081FWJ8_9GAMM|nr:DNA polymerase Y family protein [Marinobacterium lacunae]KEA62903.1 DNA polymerase-like protein [Marinobacterium lacunae]
MRWLCLHFPWLELELHGLSEEVPQVLLDSRRRIKTLNPCAEDLGIKTGQALATALALGPELVVLDTSDKRLRSALEQLAIWAGRFSARVCLCPPQALLLEIASMLNYFGGMMQLIAAITDSLRSTGYTARMAVGETAKGVQLLAAIENRLCSDAQSWWAGLYALRIDQLQLHSEQVERLQGVGLSTLQDLLELPRAELSQRFGPSLLRELVSIIDPGAPAPETYNPPEHFRQRCELAAEITYSTGLLFPLRRLLSALEGYLTQRQQKVARIHLTLNLRGASTQTLDIGHAGGCAAASAWLELCRLRLEREQLKGPVLSIELSAEQGEVYEAISGDLFALSHAQSSLPDLISRLRSRLGSEAVKTLSVYPDHRPESVLRVEGSYREVSPEGMVRPSWLLPHPQPLSKSQRCRLELLSGPERISSGWWDRMVSRDYFVARWPDGRCCWLFREPDGCWFIHGWFG